MRDAQIAADANDANAEPKCVGFEVSAWGRLVYILADGGRIDSGIDVSGGKIGEFYSIEPRRLGETHGGNGT